MGRNLIAIIDDEKEILNTFTHILKALGETVCFEDPKQFVAKIEKDKTFKPDLVLTDYAMPEMTGVEMLQKARAMGASFPTILISGNLDKKITESAANIGMCLLMEKPVRAKSLLTASTQILLVHSISKARSEISKAANELADLYTVFKDIFMNAAGSGSEALMGDTSSLEQGLEAVETRLQALRATEKMLEEMQRQNMEQALEKPAA